MPSFSPAEFDIRPLLSGQPETVSRFNLAVPDPRWLRMILMAPAEMRSFTLLTPHDVEFALDTLARKGVPSLSSDLSVPQRSDIRFEGRRFAPAMAFAHLDVRNASRRQPRSNLLSNSVKDVCKYLKLSYHTMTIDQFLAVGKKVRIESFRTAGRSDQYVQQQLMAIKVIARRWELKVTD